MLDEHERTIETDAPVLYPGSAALVDAAEKRLTFAVVGSNLAVLAWALAILLIVLPHPTHHSFGQFLLALVTTEGIIVTLSVLHGLGRAHRLLRETTAWLREGHVPGLAEAARLTRLPWSQALIILPYWLIGLIGVAVVSSFFYGTGFALVRLGVGATLAAVSALTMSVLLVERALGPVFGQLPPRTRRHDPRTGIFSRILAAWTIGSMAPLAIIAVSPEKAGLNGFAWVLLAMGISLSLVLVYFTARSFSEPLADVRRALREVQAGDLAATVEAKSLGEVGQLQVAFNAMAEGLRERERMRDLFGRNVGTEVAREALRRDGTLGGDVADASALFVDLIDSTALAQRLDPPEVVAVLNRFFEVVVHVVAAQGGWVNKFHGDGALCVFGVPESDEDHRMLALDAALALRDEIRTLAKEVPGLDAGLGVSSGLVVAGNMGAAARHEYTVIGDPVNEAARLADYAKLKPSRVVASAAAVWLSGDRKKLWRKTGEVVLRGRSKATAVYEPAPVRKPKRRA